MLRVHVETTADAELSTTLDELVAEGARRMLAAALEAEVDGYVSSLIRRASTSRATAWWCATATPSPGRWSPERDPIEVRAPRVDDRRVDEVTGEKMRFRSSILPPWARKSPKVAEVLPLMYLHGMSSGDFVPALEEFFGSAAGLSASVITRLTTDWQKERDQFAHRSLEGRRLRLRVRRRDPLQRPPGGGPPVCPGHRGCAHRRDQGAGLDHRRPPGVDRVVGRRAAGPEAPGHDRPGAGRRRRGPRVLGSPLRGLPRDGPPALLGAQDGQRHERPAQVGPARRPGRPLRGP